MQVMPPERREFGAFYGKMPKTTMQKRHEVNGTMEEYGYKTTNG